MKNYKDMDPAEKLNFDWDWMLKDVGKEGGRYGLFFKGNNIATFTSYENGLLVLDKVKGVDAT